MKIKKLPNGFGSIVKLSGNRRKPWAARISDGGKYKYIGYFSAYDEAFLCLVQCHKRKGLSNFADDLTFSDIYRLEMEEHARYIGRSTADGYRTSYNNCTALHNKPFREITIFELQQVINAISAQGIGQPSQKKTRQLFHNMYKFCIKYGFIKLTGDLSKFVDIDKHKTKYKKTPFNMRQLNRVRAIADNNTHPLSDWAKTVVMMCYCGVRPGELLAVRKSDVKIRSRFFLVRESKTAAGRNRMVPISRKTLPYFEHWLTKPGRTLISDVADGSPFKYKRYLDRFKKVMAAANCKHLPHECRHTCTTWLNDKGANKVAMQRILGHASRDVTDGVYTHKDLRQLKKAIDLL